MKISVVLPLLCLKLMTQESVAIAQWLGTFTPTASLAQPRQFHTATLLTNGKVLIAGGFSNVTGWPVWASAELYDPATGMFTPTGNMTTARYFHTATLLPDGKVLITGGNNSIAGGCFCAPLASAELYDPATGTFSAARSMTAARSGHAATLLNNGKVLLVGGPTNEDLASAELYDPSTGNFTATGDMAAARWGDRATLLANGDVLIDGGGPDDRLSAEIYDPASGVFSVSERSGNSWVSPATSTLLMNGRVLITLHPCCDFSDLAEVFDPAVGQYIAAPRMNRSRGYSTSTLLPDGNVLIAGRSSPSSSAEIYDAVNGTFSTSADLITRSEEGHTATLLPNGTVLMTGGWVCCGSTIQTAEIYRPAVLTRAPELLSLSADGRGQGAILRAGTRQIVSSDQPAVVGEVLEVYLTGLADSAIIPPQVSIGGRMAEILFFGKAPGWPFVNQVNVRVPAGVRSGPAVPVRLTSLDRPSNEVTIAVR